MPTDDKVVFEDEHEEEASDDDDDTDDEAEYVTHIETFDAWILFGFHWPKLCLIIGELGQIGIDNVLQLIAADNDPSNEEATRGAVQVKMEP